jgi:3-methylcrotonyl-CoA carboxylase beta subunit
MYDPCELRGAVPPDSRTPWDVRAVLGRILDGSRFEEFKSNYGKTLVTGGTGCRMWPLSVATTKR